MPATQASAQLRHVLRVLVALTGAGNGSLLNIAHSFGIMFARESQARPYLDGEVSSAAHSESASASVTVLVVEADSVLAHFGPTRKEVS